MCQWALQQPGGWDKRLKKNLNVIFMEEALETLESVEVSLLVFTHRGADSGRYAQGSIEL